MDVEELMKIKLMWKNPEYLQMIGRFIILKELEGRLSSWQLEAFKKSYEYKKIHGISLLKKEDFLILKTAVRKVNFLIN